LAPTHGEGRRGGMAGFVGSRGEWSFNDADSTDNEYIFHRDAAKAGAESKPTVAQAKAEAKPAKQKASAADAAEQPAVKKAKAEQPRRTTGRNRNADWNWEKRTVTE
jgi:BRCT domain type II-containing protein